MEKPGKSIADEPLDAALAEALNGEPRSRELRKMYSVLAERRLRLADDLRESEQKEPKLREKLTKQLTTLDEQIAVLREEAEISGFIEDAVRVGIEMRNTRE